MKTFVIGEMASTHDGDYEKMLRLIEMAASIGCDAVKTQWLSSAERLCERRKAPEYLASYRLLEFPISWMSGLERYCERHGIEFMCTVYLPEDVAVIEPYVHRYKVASFEAQDEELIMQIKKPMIISLGMGGRTIRWPDYQTQYLHCVSAYPTPLGEINLGIIRMWPYVGLSDHTKHPWTGALAVAVGAQIVEFHMRHAETSHENADYEVSRDLVEAREYVANIRLAEKMLGEGKKRVMPSEEKMLRYRVGQD